MANAQADQVYDPATQLVNDLEGSPNIDPNLNMIASVGGPAEDSEEVHSHICAISLTKTSYITLDFGPNPPQNVAGVEIDISFTVLSLVSRVIEGTWHGYAIR